ncbi:MAG: Nicotinamide-nucleotide adenylyltransferase [Methanosaeta sp. PtaU1.Bin112]|nr:MAG: Nicotinamide-nucleotide adenylyltransferase [Methanosaeta sp. PtaU1.Bin112]
MRGLYIGRFQPYHLGHQAVLKKIAQEVEEIVIVIGSAQESHTPENPFTGGERMEMIYAALSEIDLRECSIVTPLQDIQRNSVWVSHLRSMVPRFDVVYSNNPLVVQLMSDAGIEIRRSPMYQREQYSGTTIRKLMSENREWAGLVPASVAAFIREIGGLERLIAISKSDRD